MAKNQYLYKLGLIIIFGSYCNSAFSWNGCEWRDDDVGNFNYLALSAQNQGCGFVTLENIDQNKRDVTLRAWYNSAGTYERIGSDEILNFGPENKKNIWFDWASSWHADAHYEVRCYIGGNQIRCSDAVKYSGDSCSWAAGGCASTATCYRNLKMNQATAIKIDFCK